MLNFDSWQRCETVKALLNWALPEEGARILDVGGYPGRMRSLIPQHQWVLCDPRVDAPGDQVQGSGDALPFQDKSFDFAVSLDVLEHVHPEKRSPFLDEMVRVSKTGLILTFPHRHPQVETSEKFIRETYEELHHRPHPWLSEHAEFPLPHTESIMSRLQTRGGQIAIFNVGDLHRWLYLQLLDVVLEAIPGGLDLAEQIDSFYQQNVLVHEFKHPTYRKIILHMFDAQEPIPVSMVETSREEESQTEIELHRIALQGLLRLSLESKKNHNQMSATLQDTIHSLQAKLGDMQAAAQRQAEEQARNERDQAKTEHVQQPAVPVQDSPKSEQEREPSSLPAGYPIGDPAAQLEYIKRMEQGLRHWEETYATALTATAEANRWRSQLEQRRSFKFYKRMMRLLGQSIES